jgi:hypothetical protein
MTGNLLSASGGTADVAAGASDPGSLSVSFSTANAGTVSGTAAVAVTSDGSGIDSLGTTALGTIAVPVTATIDNYATVAITQAAGLGTLSQSGTIYTLNLGSFAVGTGDVLSSLEIANAAPANAPADWLAGALTASASPGISDNGLGSGTLQAGASTQLGIDLSTANAGVFTQTITLAVTDANASGFSEVLPGETINVTGTVLSNAVLANPVINNGTTIVLPDAHVAIGGTPNDQTTLSIGNTGNAPLSAIVLSTAGAAYAGGAISQLAPGATDSADIAAGVNNTTAGAKLGTVSLGFTSGALSDAGVAVAIPGLFPTGVDSTDTPLPGGAADTHYTADSTGSAYVLSPGYQWYTWPEPGTGKWINYIDSPATGGTHTFSTSFNLTGLDPSTAQISGVWSGDNQSTMYLNGTVVASLDGNAYSSLHDFSITSGFVAGINTLSFSVAQDSWDGLLISQISGTADMAGSVALRPQTVSVAGNVYQEAAPRVTAPSGVILHVGDGGGAATEALAVANLAPADGFSENLLAAATGAVSGGVLSASGSTRDIAAGGSNAGALNVSVSTATAGTTSGTAEVALISDGTGIDTLGTTSLGTIAVQVGATIDNYATAAIQQISGSGVLSQNGTTYDLNLGSFAAGSGVVLAGLDVSNAAPLNAPADWLSGALTAGSSVAFSDTGLGAFGTLGAGGATPFSIAFSTANAGVFTQTITLDATDSNASGFSEALAGETIVVTGTVLSGTQLAVPVINTATPIELADAHVATGGIPDDQTAVSISNAGGAALSASVLSTSGDAYAAGSISQLASGGTDSTGIAAGVNNISAGLKTGVVTLAEISGASPGVALTSQTFGVSGKVFNEAAPSVTAPANVYLHAGDGGGHKTVALTVANAAPSGPFSEGLEATAIGVVNGAAATLSGSTADIAAGGSDATSLKVHVSTASAATINATVAVQAISDGSGVDTLGTTNLGTVDVPVTITVDNYATAAFGRISGAGSIVQSGSIFTLDLGTAVAGQVLAADLGLFNTAAGPADWITGSLTAGGDAAFSNSGTGAFGAIGAGGDAGVTIGLSSGTGGVFSETISFAGTAGNPSGYAQAMGGETLVVTGTIQALPSGTVVSSNPIDFGNVRLGSDQNQAISIANTAPAGSALLDAFGGGSTGSAIEYGGVIQLAPGATAGTGLSASLDTGTAGVRTGTVYINYQADNGSGPVRYLGGGTVAVSGTVYREAVASLTGPGILYLHAGDSASEALTIANTAAADGYSENLDASLTGVAGALSGGNGSATVAAGARDATDLSVLINAGTAGIYTGAASVALTSDGAGIDGLGTVSLGTTSVAIAYNVDNYATAAIAQIGGDGSLTGGGSVYTLNLGSTQQYSNALSAGLEALNAAAGPVADLLNGTFTASGDSQYANSGLDAFSGISFGNADTAPAVTLNTGTIGTFTETIVLHGTGSNASGYAGTLAAETIDVIGTITAIPPAPPPPLPVANAYGDVHITTFDGLYYDFQAEGEFVLAQSTVAGDPFQVQVRLQPWSAGSTVSVITMLAAQVGSDRVTIALDRANAVWINGHAVTFGATGASIGLSGGGSITEVSATNFQVSWGTGEAMTVTLGGSYINTSLTLARSDTPGSIQGLWGGDTGQANDLQLADGTVLAQPLDAATLYGAYANAWRVTNATSLMDYLAGQGTGTYTDKNFPADSVNVNNLPAAILQVLQQEVVQAGITDPNQQQAAIVDLLVTGDPTALLNDLNVNQSGVITRAAVINTPQAPVPALGVAAAAANVTETAGGPTTVTYTAYLTSATGTDTVIDWAVTAPDATFLNAAAFGGTLPSGFVVIHAGQTSANFTVTLPDGVLGATPSGNLQVTISSTNGDPVFGRTAQTEVDNYQPVAGNPAIPQLTLLSGAGAFSGSNGVYTLDLGTLVAGQGSLQDRLNFSNVALAPSDFLAGTISDSGSGFTVYGDQPLTPLSAGASYQGLVLQTDSSATGVRTETIVIHPVDQNVTGYSAILPAQTITVTETVIAAAAGLLNSAGTIDLGTFYQGDVAATALSVSNVAAAGSAALDVASYASSGEATAAGSVDKLAPGATSASALYAGIDTSTPGVKTGHVTLAYVSDAGSGNTAAEGSATVEVTGTIYGPAVASLAAVPIYVHQGDGGGTATETITVSNTAPTNGYAENLLASIVNFGTYVTAASGSTVVAPGQSNYTALTASFSTANLGTYAGQVEVALSSDGTGIDTHGTTNLGLAFVTASINVDQHAVAAIEELSGNGTLTPAGVASHYVLNLGAVAQYATPLGADLGVYNDVLGTSDLLAGQFSVSGASQFLNTGFGPFQGLAAQQVDGSPIVVLSTGTVGTFTETVTLTPTGYNPSSFSEVLAPETVTITGTVVAAPLPTPPNHVGYAWGDVHLTTFDGLYYDFQAAGEFVLAQSTVAGDSFAIQARMQPWSTGSSVSVNTEIAAQIGADRVTFGIGRGNFVWIDGVAASLTSPVVNFAGGTLEQLSANSFRVLWNTGEELDVTNNGSYINATVSLPGSDAGKVQGLLGTDNGDPAKDLTLPGGTVLAQPTTYAELYGAYANAWRVTDATSLMDYGAGQNAASFTDVNFPYNQIGLGNLPADAVARALAAAKAAGITDPNLQQAAIIDYLFTGNPEALIGSANVQQQQGSATTTTTTLTAPPPVAANVGVQANSVSVVESTSGPRAVGFTVYLTSTEAAATTVDYTVTAPGAGFLSAADFGGVLPHGTVTIAAGQTSAVFTVALPANVLGSLPYENLQVLISPEGTETVFAPVAQTMVLNTGPTAGNPAQPLIEGVSGHGDLSGAGTSYVLNLGTVYQYGTPLEAGYGVLNNGIIPSDLLSGSFAFSGSGEFVNSGLSPFTPMGAGSADTAPVVELKTDSVGTFTETVTVSPTDSNATGYSASLAPITLTITGTVLAKPEPPPPALKTGNLFGDVHITTFDGLYYDFQGAGEFVVARSTIAGDSFQVQGRLEPAHAGSSVSLLTQVAAEIGSDRVSFGTGATEAGVYVDGIQYAFSVGNQLTLSGGSVTEISSGTYRVNWNTGESMTLSLNGSFIVNASIALAAADAGAVQGLLGTDNGNPSTNLQLPDGTVIPQPIAAATLYGAYANAWRVTDATSLFSYAPGETTATFTDTHFPGDAIDLATLPAAVVAAATAQVEAAGITDPNLIHAAIIDLLVTGDPNVIIGSANVQQQGVNLNGAAVSNPPPLPNVGIVADSATAIEPASGTLAVSYTVYLTAAEPNDTTIQYSVTDSGANDLGLSGIVGGTGSVQIAAGQTSAQITVGVLANALGTRPDANLQVTITPTGSEPVVGGSARTEIVNASPTAGNPALALIEQLGGVGTLTGGGSDYVLNLGTATQNGTALFANLGIENGATVPADGLSGLFTITNFTGFLNTGFDPFSSIAAGTADNAPVIKLNTGTIGVYTETVVLSPSDTNATGYSAVQNNVTLTVTGTIVPLTFNGLGTGIKEGTLFGDVHVTTFDGLYYDFQAAGEFTAAKSTIAGDSMDVQIRTRQWSPGAAVSVIDAVAAGIGSDRVTFALDRTNAVWLDGSAYTFNGTNTLTLANGSVTQESAGNYVVKWNTGESLTVTLGGSYINAAITLPQSDGPGSVQGLLGSDQGINTDFQPVVSGTTITTAQLYGAFADTWRVTPATSLLDYGAGQTTASFTDRAFPSDALSFANLPTGLQQQGLQAAIQAGITDPQLQRAAALDLIVTGAPAIVTGGQNVTQQGITTTAAGVNGGVVTPALGVSSNNAALVEPGTGNLSVGFTVYLTAAEAQATTVNYAVTAPDASYLGLSAFGGTLPSGSVTIAAGQTSAQFSISVPANVLGSVPDGNLQVTIAATGTETVLAPSAQTTIVNATVEPGTAAVPVFALLSGDGTLTHSGNAYTLSLGSLQVGEAVQNLALAIENAGAVTGNALGGNLTAAAVAGFTVAGTGPLPVIAAGNSYQGLSVAVNTAAAGGWSETITFQPMDENASGYSSALPPITLTITDTVAAAAAQASATVLSPNPLDLGNARIGDVLSRALSIENSAAAGSEALDAGVGGATGAATTNGGSFSGLTAGSINASSLVVGLSTAAGGVQTGTATVSLASDGTGIDSQGTTALTPQVINLSGTIYREATALITAPLAFVARAGGTEALSIGIANTAAADGYSEQLLANVTGASGALTVAPSTTGDINAGGSASLGVAVNTGTAGTLAAHVTLDLISDGTTIDNLGTVDLGTQTVAVTGKIYREAAASAGTLAIVAHAGQTAAASLLLGNTAAADGYSEDLIGTVIATSAGIAATSATTGDILAGNAGTIGLSFLSATAGTFTGGVTLQLASDGTPIDGLGTVDLGSRTVAVTASVYNYATAAVSQIGSAGTLSGSGNSYTLDLGTVTQAAARTQAVLKLQNIAAGLADSLTGSSAFSGTTSAFINSGFGSFGTIAAGAASGALDISLSTANTGTFSETASFNLASTDSGGSSVLAPVKITVTGTVVAPAGQVFTLTSGADTVAGGAVANTVIATNGALSAGDRIDAGSSGANALVLSGGGTFNLALPATLAGIQTINAQEGQPTNTANGIVYPSTQQTVYLRAGMNGVTVHVAPPAATGNTAPPTITIIGAANNDFIDLHDSTGADAVTMGAGESFLGGSGNDTILVTAATLGDTINGGTGAAELYFSGGGTVTLGGTVSNIATLFLAKAAGSYSVTANSIAGLVVQDANTLYADTLAAGGAGQTLTGGGAGRMTFIGGAQTTFKDSAALLKGDTIRNLLAGDQIDITGLGFVAGASSLGFGASGGNTTLQVYLGSALQTSFTVVGSADHGGFSLSADAAGTGTLIRYGG